MNHYQQTLSNGIKLLHIPDNTEVAYVAFLINSGTRDELENEAGIAHFTEHMLFKGTQKRTGFSLISRIEDVGGDINAYTNKEEICLHTAFVSKYYPRVLELLSDIVFNSTFPEKEMGKEMEVVIDEINSYKDSPAELIYDEIEELIFKNHSLGKPILGTEDSVSKFERNTILNFVDRTHTTDEMIICSSGNIKFESLVKLCEKYFAIIPPSKRNFERKPVEFLNFETCKQKHDTHQTHCVLAMPVCTQNETEKYVIGMINNILGGPGLNARLNLKIREKYGYTYNIDSNISSYNDIGLMQIYFSTESKHLNKCLKLIHNELEILKQKPLTESQLHKAKQQIMGMITIGSQNRESNLLGMGKRLLQGKNVPSLKEIKEIYMSITSNDVQKSANELFNSEKLAVLIYQ